MSSGACGRHFVTFVATGYGGYGDAATVRRADGGEVTDVLEFPADAAEWVRVTRAGAPGTFYVAVRSAGGEVTVLRLRLDEQGRALDFEPVPGGELGEFGLTCMAASPDGERILLGRPAGPSLATLLGPDGERVELRSARKGEVTRASWSATGRVAFLWTSHDRPGSPSELRVTEDGPADDLVQDSAQLALPLPMSSVVLDVESGLDGETFYLTTLDAEVGDGEPQWTRLISVSGTGRRNAQVLFELRGPDPLAVPDMWTETAMCRCGEELLAFASGSVYRIGLGQGEWERMPFAEGRPYSAAW